MHRNDEFMIIFGYKLKREYPYLCSQFKAK